MSIDLSKETGYTPAQVGRRFPSHREGKTTNPATVIRWITHGIGGIKLEAVRLGGRWLTTDSAIQRFVEALTARAGTAAPPLAATPTVSRRKREAEAASRELDALGV